MTSWQRRARVGVAVFGIASAVAVYFAYGGRRASEAPPAVRPLPPKVLQQTLKGVYEQVSNERKDFDVAFSANRTFEDGTNEVDDVRITARNRDGRVFIVTARTGRSTKDNQDIELITNVRLSASDGFELTTDHGVYNKASGVVSTAGAVAFSKGRMSGTGIGMTYEQQTEILRVSESSHINVRAEGESPAIDFTAGSAILDRLQDVLVLDRTVHVVHGAQITDADHSTALLSPEDDRIKFVELRGNSRVEGGDGPLRAMYARDIDLHYADDGQMLERAVLIGQAVAAMRGQDGAPGREFAGELLDVSVAGDGSLKRVFGEGDVVMTLPAWSGAPARVVQARTFEAKNSEGTSQTRARFTDQVVFREKSVDGAHSREARSGVLTLEMSSSDAVSSASFSDDVTFEEDDLRARAPDALYDPGDGMLRLKGRSGKGRPTVEDRRVRVEAESIDIGLEKHHIEARVRVKTTLRAEQTATDGAGAGQSAKTPSRLPRLLAQDQDAKVTADTSLVYDG
jgi:LPS export ABC transporter protein LptC